MRCRQVLTETLVEADVMITIISVVSAMYVGYHDFDVTITIISVVSAMYVDITIS